MARFYFDLRESGRLVPDEEGIEQDSLADARTIAITAARDVMAGNVQRGELCLGWSIEVRDLAGATVLSVPFRDAVTLTER